MANIITNTEVFNFMGTRSDVVTDRGSDITTLITTEQAALEKMLGRSVISNSFTDKIFDTRLGNIYISPNDSSVLFFTGVYRDMYSISALSEAGSDLDPVASYLDENDYILDPDRGVLTRIGGYWDSDYYSLVMSGKYGYVDQSDDSALPDVKQLLIEIVATRSRLWKDHVITPAGAVDVIRNKLDKSILNRIKSLKNRSLV